MISPRGQPSYPDTKESRKMVKSDVEHDEVLPMGTVLIAGGGPVGMLVAKVLSHYGVKSVLLERNKTTTKWPKMDLTNPRSMEIFRRLGLTDAIRKLGVPAHCGYHVIISSGLSMKDPITKWDLPSVEQYEEQIRTKNDGSQPLEAWQRISQVIFEKMLKKSCDEDPLIDVRFGWRVEDVIEEEHLVKSRFTNVDTSDSVNIVSDYLVGCDGASSRTRKALEFPLDGGPMYVPFLNLAASLFE
jgi:2-polyprenyl-6-methoxyphenol hydroxylase-like FAD-dependent oxidoreductase